MLSAIVIFINELLVIGKRELQRPTIGAMPTKIYTFHSSILNINDN